MQIKLELRLVIIP